MLFINIVCLYLISMTIAGVYWAVHIRTLNGSNYARAILLLCFAVCFYIFGYVMELNSSSQSQILFWNRVEYVGIPYVSALWLTTGLMYTGHFTRYKKTLLAAIFGIPIFTMVLRLTNDYHFLYFSSVSFTEGYGKLLLVKKIGPWMYVQLIHSLLMILLAMGLFIHDFMKSEEKQKGKIVLTVTASFFAVAGLILSVIKPFGLHLDYMAMCLPITCVAVILAISRYDLLETKSIARSRVFESSSDAILLVNRQNKVLDYNCKAKHLFEQINIHMDDGYLTTLFRQAPDLVEGLTKTGTSVVKLCIHDEERYYAVGTEQIEEDGVSRGWIKTIRDVTEIYQLNEELKKQAMIDELSGLYNRRAFLQSGQEWTAKSDQSGRSLHLLMLDLDHFKNVNDQYGHPAGDLAIQDFGRILKKHFSTDSLVARLGGEEFAILHTGFSDTEMQRAADTLQEYIAQHEYSYRGSQFHVTVSIGVTKKLPGQTLESMMRKADKALYQSKDKGRNCVTVL